MRLNPFHPGSAAALVALVMGVLAPSAGGQTPPGPPLPNLSATPQATLAAPQLLRFEPDYRFGEVLVRFEASAGSEERAEIRRDQGATLEQKLPLSGLQLVEIDPDSTVAEAVEAFEGEPGVRYAEPNFIRELTATPNDPQYAQLWGQNNTGQSVNGTAGTADADVDMPEAWDLTTGSSAITVAVLDSGVAYENPDLSPNMWANPGETGSGKETNGVDDDGNGRVDDHRGWNFVSNNNNPMDENGHGTHVAGTIGARGNNSMGVTGANWQVKLMALKMFGPSGSGSTAQLLNALDYANDNGAKVLNGSFGGTGYSQAESDEITGDPGTLFVFSAGNGGADSIGDNNDVTPQYPCNYSPANVICVAATDQNDNLASFSNHGVTAVDVAAPGTNIVSTYPAREFLVSESFDAELAGRWTTGGTNNTWARTASRWFSAPASLTDSAVGDYANNTSSFAQLASSVSFSGRTGCKSQFTALFTRADVGDVLTFERSTDGGATWAPIRTMGALSGNILSDDLSSLLGQSSVLFRFKLSTDGAGTADGALLDDLSVACFRSGPYEGYTTLQGTSMATPQVAGIAALAAAYAPSASVANIKSALLSTVDAKVGLTGKVGTGGRVNARAAVVAAGSVDTTAPAVSITSPTSASTFATTASTITLGGSASDNVGLQSVSWSNATNGTSGTATGTTSWSTAAIGLVAGPNTITVTATDSAGNTATDTITVTRDNTAPAVTITSPTTDPTRITQAATITLGGTASDNVELASVTWSNAANSTSGTATGTTSWGTAAITLAAGQNTITVRATDTAGITATDTITVTRDNTAPAVSITGPTTDPTRFTQATSVSLSGSATDNVALASVTWSNAANSTSGTATGTATWSTAAITLAAGQNVITVTVTDIAGNTGTDTITVTRDNTAPAVSITSPTSLATYTTQAASLALAGTASDNVAVGSVSWLNQTNFTSGSASGTTSWSAASIALAAGQNVITVTVTDTAGNTATDTITVTRDSTAPSVSITTPTAQPALTTSASAISLEGTASDNVALASVTWSNAANSETGTASGTSSWSAASIPLAAGQNVITVTATDTAGNTATDAITVTRDDTKPTVGISSPTSDATHATTSATIGLAGSASDNIALASVTWSNAANSTSGTATGTTSWSVPSIALANGDNAITITATDTAGNTATDTITVTRENAAPAGTSSTVSLVEDGEHSFAASAFGFTDPDVGDSLSAVRFDTLPSSGTLRADGNPVTAGQVVTVSTLTSNGLTYTPPADACGVSHASFAFSVRDQAGVYDPTPNTITLNVACVDDPVEAPTFSGTDPASPANSSITKITGSAPSGSTVTLYTQADCTGTPAASGTAASFASPGLPVTVAPNSSTTFHATATRDGVTSACSTGSVSYVEDSAGPAPTLTAPADGSATGDSSPAFAGVGGRAARDTGTVTVRIWPGTSAGAGIADYSASAPVDPSTGAYSTSGPYTTAGLSSAATLPDGTYTARAFQSDSVGNEGQSAATRTFTVDTVAPDTAISSGPEGTTASNDPSFGFAATVANAGGKLRCRLDGPGAATAGYADCTSPKAYTGLADGSYTFRAYAVDAAGNEDPTPATRAFTVATAAPEPPVSPAPPDADRDGSPDAEDCDDANASVRPGAAELPGNGVDEDCSGADAPAPIDPNAATSGDDTLTGSAAGETICGLLGNDVINGLAGNDTLFGDLCNVKAKLAAAQAGAGGDDTLNGGAGNDTIYGAGGNDKLVGDDGNDKLFGGKGRDSLDGGKGNDTLTGGPDVDTYRGGAGDDTVDAKNGKVETVDCGAGKKDFASVDKRDKVKGCEKVKRATK